VGEGRLGSTMSSLLSGTGATGAASTHGGRSMPARLLPVGTLTLSALRLTPSL
jgi:hypothetical protein